MSIASNNPCRTDRLNNLRALTVLILLMLGGLLLSVVITSISAFIPLFNEISIIRCSITLQNLLAFIAPAILMPVIVYGKSAGKFSVGNAPHPSALIWFILIYATATPAINYATYINEALTLPESLSSLEQWMRASEESAKAVTDKLMANSSLGNLFANILYIGIITGIGEELFFRGALQNVFVGLFRNKHVAVWIGAVVFSAFHLQFYGFIPRMLMGALFGYARLWTGSFWVPATIHAINNSTVVVLNYLAEKGIADDSYSTIGAESGFPILAIASIIMTIILLTTFHLNTEHKQKLWH